MDLSKLVEWIKLSPKYLLPISLVSGFLLLANEKLLQSVGLDEFVNVFRAWIGIIFLLASALLVVDVGYGIFTRLSLVYKNLRTRRNRFERLRNSTSEEKDILLSFLLEDTRTQYFAYKDGVVLGLKLEGILYEPSNVGDLGRWPFNIQPWAWKMLRENTKEIFSNEDVDNYRKAKTSILERSRSRAGHVHW